MDGIGDLSDYLPDHIVGWCCSRATTDSQCIAYTLGLPAALHRECEVCGLLDAYGLGAMSHNTLSIEKDRLDPLNIPAHCGAICSLSRIIGRGVLIGVKALYSECAVWRSACLWGCGDARLWRRARRRRARHLGTRSWRERRTKSHLTRYSQACGLREFAQAWHNERSLNYETRAGWRAACSRPFAPPRGTVISCPVRAVMVRVPTFTVTVPSNTEMIITPLATARSTTLEAIEISAPLALNETFLPVGLWTSNPPDGIFLHSLSALVPVEK